MTLSPAWGRDYKSRAEVAKAINDRKDFMINDPFSQWNGKPCTPADLTDSRLTVRYAQLRKVVILKKVGNLWVPE